MYSTNPNTKKLGTLSNMPEPTGQHPVGQPGQKNNLYSWDIHIVLGIFNIGWVLAELGQLGHLSNMPGPTGHYELCHIKLKIIIPVKMVTLSSYLNVFTGIKKKKLKKKKI